MAAQSRRAFLRAAAVAPVAAPAAVHGIAQQAQLGMAGVSVLGHDGGGCDVAVGSSEAMTFTKFADFLAAGGEREIREQSRHVSTLDPDIVVMNLPITTKIQWQRKRNFERALEGRREGFLRAVKSNGFFKWWP